MIAVAFPWGPFAAGIALGLAIGWMAIRGRRGKAVLPGASQRVPGQLRWMIAGLFPASGFFIFAALARAAHEGTNKGTPLALSLLAWPAFCVAAALCCASAVLLVALLIRPSLVDTKLRFLKPPGEKSGLP
jgi:hypothetical protein